MKFSLDVNECEQQRYDLIKKAGRYLEFDILIDARDDDDTDKNKMPVITTVMHCANSKAIAQLYTMLNAVKEQLEETYPMECLLSKMTMSYDNVGYIETDIKHKEKEEEQ